MFALISGLIWTLPARAQETGAYPPPARFTDQVLAPRADWYRPDLAARRVRQLTRAFRGSREADGQLLGIRHPLLRSDRQAREVLTYNAAGYLLRYRLVLPPAKAGRPAPRLENVFHYAATGRLSRIDINGSRRVTSVVDIFSSKAYARQWAGAGNPNFRQRHQLPPWPELQQVFPDTWQLRHIQLRYDAHGRPWAAQALVELTTHTYRRPLIGWTDTVRLDPRCDWYLATADTLAGFADTAWHRPSDRWWQLQVPASAAPGLLVQHLPATHPYYAQYPMNEAHYGLTSFFDAAGRLVLARQLGTGTVWRYTYDAQGQPLGRETYLMHLPHRYGDTLYFGGVSGIYPMPDCEQRQRRAFPTPMPDGAQAVREWQRTQQLRYTDFQCGLPRRALVRTTRPRYAVDVSFDEMLSISRPTGHNSPSVLVKNWRQVQAQFERRQELIKQGCVPMTLDTTETQVIRLRYRFFRELARSSRAD